MHDPEHQPGPALFDIRVGTVIAALIGLILAAFSLLVFVFDLLVTPEIGALIASFVVCGVGLTTGFMVLRRLVPRRETISLFGGSSHFSVQATPQAETSSQVEHVSQHCTEPAIVIPQAQTTDTILNRNKSVSSYTARETSGAMCLIIAIGVSLILGGRLSGGWTFLAFALPAGFLVALALYWIRQKQDSSLDAQKIPVAGGVVGFICMTGLGIVMIRSHLLRDFFGLAIGAGGAVALILSRARHRRQNANISFL
jgi:hypothetical protein